LDGITRDLRQLDKDTFLTNGGAGLGKAGIHTCIIRHIDLAEDAAKILGNLFAFFFLKIENGDLDAMRGKRAGCCLAEA